RRRRLVPPGAARAGCRRTAGGLTRRGRVAPAAAQRLFDLVDRSLVGRRRANAALAVGVGHALGEPDHEAAVLVDLARAPLGLDRADGVAQGAETARLQLGLGDD